MTRWRGKTAVITGGAGGIGRAVAKLLVERGAKVALWDVDAAALEAACGELGRERVRPYRVDLCDPSAIREAASRVEAEVGPPDLLDLNAGVYFPGDFLEASDADIAATLAVNLDAVLWCSRAFLPGMVRRKSGRLVLMASAAGLTGVPGMAVYSATKHAVVGFAESLRLELAQARSGVGVTVVCPSYVRTKLFAGARPPRLLPWLEPERLAAKIISAVERGRPHLREPFMVKLLPALKTLPTPLLDWASEALGVHDSLKGMRRARGR